MPQSPSATRRHSRERGRGKLAVMADYVELPIGDGDYLKVEVSTPGLVQAGADGVIERVAERFDEVLGRLIQIGRDTVIRARESAEPPHGIDVELGLKLTAKTGFVIAESSGEAQFKVTLHWAPERP